MADLSEYWRRHKAILTSGAEQSRSEAVRLMEEINKYAEDTGQDGYEIIQGLINHALKDERIGIAMLGHLAEVGLIHCLLAEFD